MLQLHGSESTDRVEEIKNNSDLKIIKTFGINQEKDFDTTKVYEDISDYFLFDSKPLEKDLPGGNAKSFEWKLLESHTSNKDFFLSGGLTVENVETAVNSHYTNFFDVSSGVESSPGVKDKQKITDFINKIKK
jgi:phosphoribosylanthranilate isomerase